MQDLEDLPGIDMSDHSTLTSHHDNPAYSHDLQSQPVRNNNNALDIGTQEKAPQDPNIVDWNGPDDPENPLNWSSAKKFAAISIVSLVTMLS